ncbi:hypothetical protein HYE34_01210 [Mycoplasmopsis bovis]|nr:hypothetical protein HYE34_01210 [Mycoplasmopsis bovis]
MSNITICEVTYNTYKDLYNFKTIYKYDNSMNQIRHKNTCDKINVTSSNDDIK